MDLQVNGNVVTGTYVSAVSDTQPGRVALSFVAAISVAIIVAMPTPAATSDVLHAEIRTTSYGVPHIMANDLAGAGFGLGFAFAKSDICEIAGRWVTVNAQRSRYFGPDVTVPTYARPGTTSNLQSDFLWQW